MGLKGYQAPRETVSIPGGQVVVRGLAAPAVMQIVKKHFPALSVAFARAVEAEKSGMTFEHAQALQALAAEVGPECVATIIAYGCDEPDEEAAAASLPVSTQMVLLDKIVQMTFAQEGGLKNVVAIVAQAVSQAKSINDSLT